MTTLTTTFSGRLLGSYRLKQLADKVVLVLDPAQSPPTIEDEALIDKLLYEDGSYNPDLLVSVWQSYDGRTTKYEAQS